MNCKVYICLQRFIICAEFSLQSAFPWHNPFGSLFLSWAIRQSSFLRAVFSFPQCIAPWRKIVSAKPRLTNASLLILVAFASGKCRQDAFTSCFLVERVAADRLTWCFPEAELLAKSTLSEPSFLWGCHCVSLLPVFSASARTISNGSCSFHPFHSVLYAPFFWTFHPGLCITVQV